MTAAPNAWLENVFRHPDLWTVITCHDRHTAERIAQRCIVKGWPFYHRRKDGAHQLALDPAIDLERDLRARLPGLRFGLG